VLTLGSGNVLNFGRAAAFHRLELWEIPKSYVVHDIDGITAEGDLSTGHPHIEAFDALRIYCETVGAHRVLNRNDALRKFTEMSQSNVLVA